MKSLAISSLQEINRNPFNQLDFGGSRRKRSTPQNIHFHHEEGEQATAGSGVDKRPYFERSISSLIGALKDTNYNVRALAEHILTESFAERGINVIPALLKAASNERHASTQYISGPFNRIVSEMPEEIAIPALIEAAKNGNLDTRFHALNALVHFPETAIPVYIEALKDKRNWDVRWRGLIGLESLLRTGQVDNRTEVISEIVLALRDENESVRSEAEKFIVELGQEATPVLVKELQKEVS